MVHDMPGRVRVRVAWIKSRRDLADVLAARMGRLAGVSHASANPYCASLTLRYDPAVWTAAALCRRIDKLAPRRGERPGYRPAPDRSAWYELSLSSFGLAAAWTKSAFAPVLLPLCVAGSAVPMLARAYHAFAREDQLTVDVLDASATAVLCAQGQFEMAMFMIWLVNLGDYVRDATVAHARKTVSSVLSYQQSSAWVVKGPRTIKTPVLRLAVGDQVVVHSGDRIPVDGTVLAGAASVDEQTLTGESVPKDKTAGDRVFAATVVRDGTLRIKTAQVGDDTEAAKIVRMVDDAPAHETAMQNYAERWANGLVPYSFLGAGIRGLVEGGASGAASVLVVDYGTGIRVAAPTAVLATMAEAVRHGVLFKGGRSLEALATVDAVVFDKTGTLSLGVPRVTDVRSYDGLTGEQVLALAASAEGSLNHPVAQAIGRAAAEAGVPLLSAESSRYAVGLGVGARLRGSLVHVGGLRYMNELGVNLPSSALRQCRDLAARAVSPVCVAMDGSVVGVLGYADSLREETPRVIERLRALGMKEVTMLTGDQEAVARRAAAQAGIESFAAELLPDQKVAYIETLQRRGLRVAAVGDGINDSPALSHADVGLALRSGADIAQESAHVVLLSGTLESIPLAVELAREAIDTIRESWRIISVPNTVALALAFAGMLGPGMATLLSNGAAIVATGHALGPLWKTRADQSRAERARVTSASVTDRTTASRISFVNS
ncbi:MAG TPA: heavy metal translocating P-type ATPase [Nitrospira sp.]|nr:heavy metal translocating P-type ATPase [Nitrospira sp.]